MAIVNNLQGVPQLHGFHYRRSHNSNFWLMYSQVGDFCISRGPPTCPKICIIRELGMARGIPRPSVLEVPDLFSLLDSPRNRFYNSSAPRVLAKVRRGSRNTEFPLNMKISESFQKFVKIFLCFRISFWY